MYSRESAQPTANGVPTKIVYLFAFIQPKNLLGKSLVICSKTDADNYSPPTSSAKTAARCHLSRCHLHLASFNAQRCPIPASSSLEGHLLPLAVYFIWFLDSSGFCDPELSKNANDASRRSPGCRVALVVASLSGEANGWCGSPTLPPPPHFYGNKAQPFVKQHISLVGTIEMAWFNRKTANYHFEYRSTVLLVPLDLLLFPHACSRCAASLLLFFFNLFNLGLTMFFFCYFISYCAHF